MLLKKIRTILFSESALIIYLILFLIPLLYLSIYIHPSADDFVYSSWFKNPNHTSFWEYHRQNYLTWNGRYFSTLLLAINPLVYKWLIGYKIIPFILIGIFYSGLFLLLSEIFNLLNKRMLHIITLLILLVYLNLVPSLPETLYWMSASITYLLAWGLTFYWLYFLILYYKNPCFKYVFISIVLMFCIIGTNELSAFLSVFLLLIIALLEIIYLRKLRKGTIIFLVFCIVLLCVVIIAPGNTVRQTNYPNHHNITYALSNAVINLLRISALIFKSTAFIFLLLMAVLNTSEIQNKLLLFKTHQKLNLYILTIIPFLIVYFFYFISAYSMGINPPLRVHGFIVFFVIFSVLFIIIRICSSYDFLALNHNILKKLNIILIGLFLLSILGDFHKKPGDAIYIKGNIMQATYDVIFTAPIYNKEMNYRNKIIEQSKKDTITLLTVPALSYKPQSIFFVDIKPDTTYWVNWATALYFDIHSIKTDN